MNWKKEIDRIDLDFMDVDHHSMEAHYKIANVYFIVQIDWWKNNYDFETARYDIDINVKSGVWWTDNDPEDKVMEFEPSYKEWMLNMIEHLMDEREFLSEYTWGNDNDEIDWEEYGI
jgi:hypothetical protein